MTPEELATIEALANAATPGPWQDDGSGWVIANGRCIAETHGANEEADTAFIAAASTAVRELIAEVRRLQIQVNGLFGGVSRNQIFEMGKAAAREETKREPRYSTEAVDALVDIVREHMVGLFAAHLQSGADQSLLPAELKELDEALEVVRASREPKP